MMRIIPIVLLLVASGCGHDAEDARYSDADWSFAVIGDIRAGYDTYTSLLEIIDTIVPPPRFLLINGDHISNPGNDQEWNQFHRATSLVSDTIPVFSSVGNHDVDSLVTEAIFRENVPLQGYRCYYSFVQGDFYFIILDTEVPGEVKTIGGAQYAWLEDELDTAQGRGDIQTIVLAMHRPLFQSSGIPGNILNTFELLALFESHSKVKLVISSHVQAFYSIRRNGILYIVTGGGGEPFHYHSPGEYHHFTWINIYIGPERINVRTIGIFGEMVANFDY
ncbi:MAG: metallophosphoesterase [Spirochaetes bacterium]|nr:metallophosphoesterase [Spirochaetota bacterium]